MWWQTVLETLSGMVGAAWDSIGTIVLIIYASATVWMAWAATAAAGATRQSVKELAAAREVETRAYLIAYPYFTRKREVHFVIKNIGRGPAEEVEIDADPLIEPHHGSQGLAEFLQRGISYLPPGGEVRFWWAYGLELFAEHPAPTHLITLRYRSKWDGNKKDKETESYTIALEDYRRILIAPETPGDRIAQALEGMESRQTMQDGFGMIQRSLNMGEATSEEGSDQE